MSKEKKQVQEMKEILAQNKSEEKLSRLAELLFVNGIAVGKTIKNINTDPKAMKLIKKKVEYLALKYEKPLEHLKQLIKEHKACLKKAKEHTLGYKYEIKYALERCENCENEAYKIIKKGLEPEMAYEFIRESLERKLKNAEKAEKMAKKILEA